MLTGKAKTQFDKWLNDKYFMLPFEPIEGDVSELLLRALYIDFFDSVGIYIIPQISTFNGFHHYCIGGFYNGKVINGLVTDYYLTRHEATKAAIERANDLLNEKYK